jgi:hypothetical protein
MDTWNFKITGYEVGRGVNFQKMPCKKEVQVFGKVRPSGHICICDTQLIPDTKTNNTHIGKYHQI